MSIIRDTQSEIIVRKARIVFRVLAGIMALIGMMFLIAGLVQSLSEVNPAYLIMAGIGLFVALLGISFVTLSTKINFNTPPGYMTVTLGYYPSLLPSLRTRIISREEAKSVFVYPVEGTVTNQYGVTATKIIWYQVKVAISSGREFTLHTDARQHIPNRLAERILGFAIGDSEASSQKLDRSRLVKSNPSAKFSMRIQGVLVEATSITGAWGILVEGIVEQGTIQDGDEVVVRDYRSTKRARVSDVDTLNGFGAPDKKMRLIIEGLTGNDVMLGDIVERV